MISPSREMQTKLMQTKVYHKLSLPSLKRSVTQTFKSSSCKKVFPKCVYHWYNLLRCFSFHVITASSIFYTNLSLPRGLVQPPCCFVLLNKCFERSPHFISIISTIIRFKIKLLLLKFSQKIYLLIAFLLHSLIL